MEVMTYTATRTPFDALGPAASVAYNPNAPTDEVEDAGSMLMKAYSGIGLPNQLDIQQIVTQMSRLKRAEAAGDRLLAKAIGMMHPEAEKAKARTEPWVTKVGGGGKYIPKPGIPMLVLRSLKKRLEVAKAFHRVWIRKVLLYAKPSTKPDEPGFQLFHSDPNAQLDERQNDMLQWLTSFLVNGGRDFDAATRKRFRRQTFPRYIQQVVDDSLTFDFVVTEKVPLKQGVPGLDSFYVRDGATFYLANFGHVLEDDETYAYQIAYGTQEIPFTAHELGIWQRNVDSDLNSAGYSTSELEDSVDTISKWITAMAYTQEGLDNNAIPRGILSVFGQFDRNTRELFKAAWDAKIRGVQNAHNLPVLFGAPGQMGDVKFTATGQPFNEMAFAKWIALQSSIMGAIYGIDPKEIGLDTFTAGTTSTLSGDDTQERLTNSKITNFNPFMTSLADYLRDELVSTFAPWVGTRFNGLISESAQKRQEEKRRMSTINEIRHDLGMDPHPLGWFGNLPADPSLQSAEFQRMQQTMTYDEARQAWGGLKIFPSELVGLTPLNPSMGAVYNMAVQAAGQEAGGGEGEAGDPGQNPFEAMNPAQGGPQAEGDQEDDDKASGDQEASDGQEKPGLFDEGDKQDDEEEPDDSLKGQVASRLKQV